MQKISYTIIQIKKIPGIVIKHKAIINRSERNGYIKYKVNISSAWNIFVIFE